MSHFIPTLIICIEAQAMDIKSHSSMWLNYVHATLQHFLISRAYTQRHIPSNSHSCTFDEDLAAWPSTPCRHKTQKDSPIMRFSHSVNQWFGNHLIGLSALCFLPLIKRREHLRSVWWISHTGTWSYFHENLLSNQIAFLLICFLSSCTPVVVSPKPRFLNIRWGTTGIRLREGSFCSQITHLISLPEVPPIT